MNMIKFSRPLLPLLPSDIFDDLFKGLDTFGEEPFGVRLKGFPRGDVFLENGNVVIELALAGYKKDQLSVKVDVDGSLVVSADQSKDDQSNGRALVRRTFNKRFPQLGREWDVCASDVSYCDGLLKITVPPLVKKEDLVKELVIR